MGFFDRIGGLFGAKQNQEESPFGNARSLFGERMQGKRGPFDFGEAALSLFADPQVMADRRRRRMHEQSFQLPDGGMGRGIY